MNSKHPGDKREKHRKPVASPKPKSKTVKELYAWFSTRNPDSVIVTGENYGQAVVFAALPRSVSEQSFAAVYPAHYIIDKASLELSPFSVRDCLEHGEGKPIQLDKYSSPEDRAFRARYWKAVGEQHG